MIVEKVMVMIADPSKRRASPHSIKVEFWLEAVTIIMFKVENVPQR